MGWSGRVPAPPTSKAGDWVQFQGACSCSAEKLISSVIGIDIGKNFFHVVGLDKRGAIILRQK